MFIFQSPPIFIAADNFFLRKPTSNISDGAFIHLRADRLHHLYDLQWGYRHICSQDSQHKACFLRFLNWQVEPLRRGTPR